MHGWLDRIADEFPERPFVVTDTQSFTYAQVVEWSRHIAAGLAAGGIGRGDHVAVLVANRPEYVAVKFALSRLGAVIVPLNVMYRRDDVGFVLGDSRSKALITMTGFRGEDYLGMLDAIAPGWDSEPPRPELEDLRLVVQIEAEQPARAGVPTLGDLARPDDIPEVAGPTDVASDDVSVIFYTSGTTGRPKGVMWTHDAEGRLGYGAALSRAFGDGWRVQSALPLFHAFANNEVMNASMFVGGSFVPRLQFDARDFLAAIERHRPQEIVAVPTMVVDLCQSPLAEATSTDSLVGLMCAGAQAPAWLWERAVSLLGVTETTTGYGMTETGGGQVMSQPEDGLDHVVSTVGRIKLGGVAALPGMNGLLAEMRTIDPATGEPLPEGAEGELISRGPTNAIGYWNRPEADAETFRDGWVHTGDLGRVRADGLIELTGRKKELIRTGAENVAPKEVEDLLTGQPGVSQAFVVGLPDVKWGEVVCAYVVPDAGALVTEDELSAVCREQLASFKRPRFFRFIAAEELPKTPTGKVQKVALVERAKAWYPTAPSVPAANDTRGVPRR